MPAVSTWLADPVIRYGVRNSFFGLRVLPLGVGIAIELQRPANGRSVRLACLALCFAGPLAAACLLEMEHDGRLDQMRLAGRRPMSIAATALLGVAAPWWLIGLVLMAWSMLAGSMTPAAALALVAIAGLTTMLAAISTTVSFARQNVDPRIGVAALVVVAAAVGVIGADLLYVLTATSPIFLIAILIEAAVITRCLWRLPRRLARPPVSGMATSPRSMLPLGSWLLPWPAVYRGVALSVSGLMLFALFAPVGILVRILIDEPRGPAPPESAALYLPPLFIGMIAVSLICREDAISGRLDIVRQSSTRVADAGLQMLIGLWAPFVAASLGLAILAAALFGVSSTGLLVGALILIWLAPMPVLEGWLGLWPLTMTLPVAMTIMMLTLERAWPATALVAGVVWIAAARALGHPERATITGWLGVVATIAVCALPSLTAQRLLEHPPGLVVACALMALSPILIDPRRESGIDRWGQPLAIVGTTFLTTALKFDVEGAIVATVMAIAVWHAARRIRLWNPSRPAHQAAARLAFLSAGMAFFSAYVVPRLDSATVYPWPLIALTAALTLAATVEVLFWVGPAAGRRWPILRP
jgi:hypothetical protein